MGTKRNSKSRLVSIDPGTRWTGWAEFFNGELANCGLVRAKGLAGMLEKVRPVFKPYGDEAWPVAIEIPQVYVQRKQKGDANDLIKVALVAGYIGALFIYPEFILPRTWKGTVDKDVMCDRVRDRWMTQEERDLLASQKIADYIINNTIDAIGVGIHTLGRHR